MDKLDIQIQQKKFFKIVYGDLIGEGGNLKENNYIRIFQTKDNFSKVKFFNNVDDLVQYTSSHTYNLNTYFTLSTTTGESGTEKDLQYRAVLAFDFDKKDLGENFSYKDIMERFKSLGLWYHILIDSGHGFHTYTCVEPTQDLHKVQEVQKAIGKLLGADLNALKSTQILRVPYSFNVKDKPKQVNIIKMFEKDTIKRYSIDKLYNRFCCNARDEEIGNRATKFVLNNSYSIRPCIQQILKNGSIEGHRNEDLQKIVITLKRLNKSLNDIKQVCREWNSKNNPTLTDYELKYQVEYIYNNISQCSYNCRGCKYTNECFNKTESDFIFDDAEDIINIEYKVAKKLKYTKRGLYMNGNELLIFNVLKHWGKELNIDEIIKHLTYKNKCALSEKTIRDTLKKLEDKKFIIKKKGIKKQGIKDTYKINTIKCDIDKTFNISYFPTLICIYGIIRTEDLRLYHYMRYKHDVLLKDNKANGNIFRINQDELAKDLMLDKSSISRSIKKLLETKILEIWDIKKNEKGFDYYTYRLVK